MERVEIDVKIQQHFKEILEQAIQKALTAALDRMVADVNLWLKDPFGYHLEMNRRRRERSNT